MKPESPCYECPKHQLGCRNECEEWQDFEAAKAELYAEKVKAYNRNEVLHGYKRQKISQRINKEHMMRRK